MGRHSYTHRLAVCGAQAIRELADLPCTPAVQACVMGRAMELLREKHGVNVPRGWYPAMKELRRLGREWPSVVLPPEATGILPSRPG